MQCRKVVVHNHAEPGIIIRSPFLHVILPDFGKFGSRQPIDITALNIQSRQAHSNACHGVTVCHEVGHFATFFRVEVETS